MPDVHTPETRSYNMSRIRGKDTAPELIVRKFLFSNGYRYRLHQPDLPGKPDIVLRKYKTVIFVNGCFWHGHKGCRYFVVPRSRRDWWLEKINRTILNDHKKQKALRLAGWKVVTIWECQLKPKKVRKTVTSLLQVLR